MKIELEIYHVSIDWFRIGNERFGASDDKKKWYVAGTVERGPEGPSSSLQSACFLHSDGKWRLLPISETGERTGIFASQDEAMEVLNRYLGDADISFSIARLFAGWV